MTGSCNFFAAPARVRSIDGAEDAPFLDVKGAEDDALGVWLFFFCFQFIPFLLHDDTEFFAPQWSGAIKIYG